MVNILFIISRYVAIFSIERFIVVFFPLKRKILISKFRSKCVAVLLAIFSIFIYSFSLITSVIENNSCVTQERWINLAIAYVLIDIIIAIVSPFITVIIANILIIIKLMSFQNKFEDTESKNSVSRENNSIIQSRSRTNSHRSSMVVLQIKNSKNILNKVTVLSPSALNKRHTSYSRTTRMLFILSFSFLTLQAPIVYSKFAYLIKNVNEMKFLFKDSTQREDENSFDLENNTKKSNKNNISVNVSDYEEIIERITCYIYYLNYSLNFLFYALNGLKLKKVKFLR